MFSASAAEKLNLDPTFLYPASLARQYAPNDLVFSSAKWGEAGYYDISIDFNADMNWWFANPEVDTLGETLPIRNEYVGDGYLTGNMYDFEQIAIHELLHGLGFISSWYPWLGDDYILPGWLSYGPNGTITGLEPSYLYDRNLAFSGNQTWMTYYSDRIRSIATTLSQKLKTTDENQWYREFTRTEAAKIGAWLKSKVAVTPQSVVSFFPLRRLFDLTNGDSVQTVSGQSDRVVSQKTTTSSNIENTTVAMDFGYAVVYTPVDYSRGSTFSHIDAAYYEGTTEFLMRPFGTPNVGLDGFIPKGKNGPIGRNVLGILRAMGYATALGPI